jgi:hypothetical protein
MMATNPYVLDFSGPQNMLARYHQAQMQQRSMDQQQGQFDQSNILARERMGQADRHFNASNMLAQAQDARAAALSPLQQRQLAAEAAMAERRLTMPMDDGSKVHEVNGQLVRVPRQGQGEVVYGSDPKALRRQEALAMGMQPGSPEALFYEANGKVPAKFYEQKAQDQRRAESAPKITEGLRNLAKAPDTYGASFESAVGPWQGTDPDSLASAPFVNTARAIGEISNKLGGGKFSPTEVRSNIKGSTEALAASIKPLIRAPGEGVWTDADQARLVAVVGDLATASTADEYYRRLNDVRDRIKANFGLDINFEANPKNNARLPPTGGQPAPAQASGASQPLVRVSTPEEAMRLPPGTQFMTPDGRVKVR